MCTLILLIVQRTTHGKSQLRFRASQLRSKLTRAEVTAVSTSTWKSLNLGTQLMKPDIYLYGPDRSQLKVLGVLPVSLCYRDMHTDYFRN